ncbi:MAG: 30S ribosome-binding factor RbfA [Lachnospiraceae bacterium]|nr:30S ribosome-binding factor RbfA [Lachnospiraceae bacterium]
MRKNSTKNNRINGEVMRALSEIIREVKDPRVPFMTTVTRVSVAPDLKTCKVYISIMGDKDEALEGLNSAKGFIRRELAHIVNLRLTPELTFYLDDSIEYGVNMSKRIDEVLEQDALSSDDFSDREKV